MSRGHDVGAAVSRTKQSSMAGSVGPRVKGTPAGGMEGNIVIFPVGI